MKLEPVTKLYKRNKTTVKKFDDDVMSESCDITVIFPIYGQFGAIRMPDSGRIISTFSLIATFYLIKTENRTKRSNTAFTLLI